MPSILDDVRLPERAVRRLGIALVAFAVALPLAAVVYNAATWEPSGEVESIGPLRPELVILQPGTFRMGSPLNVPHVVTLSRRFALSRTEITQGQYLAVMGERPVDERNDSAGDRCSDAGLGDDLPVVCVDWLEAVLFCNALSKQEGLKPVYTVDGTNVTWNADSLGYRLPTEAEWEFAARAGTRHRWAGTDDETAVCDFANVFGCSDSFEGLTHVGSKSPNRWQIYDMTGNAWEWVWDGWDGSSPYPEGSVVDPTGDPSASGRVLRGGSWRIIPRFARVAFRLRDGPSIRFVYLGFRVARSLPSSL